MIALASLDISTGEFEVGEVPAADFPGEIVRLSPERGDRRRPAARRRARAAMDRHCRRGGDAGARRLLRQPGRRAAAQGAARRRRSRRLRRLLARRARGHRRAPQVRRADADRPAARACARRARPGPPTASSSMRRAARASSCCARSAGERQGSLLAAIDRTVTGPGARELAARLASPLRDPAGDRRAARCGRLPARERDPARGRARALLRTAPDIARAISRLALQRGEPRDLGAVRDGLAAAQRLRRPAARRAPAASACRTRWPPSRSA